MESDNLTKLITQYERETGIDAQWRFFPLEFVEWIANRPTCGVEQRKFLDEVEKMVVTLDGIRNKHFTLVIVDEYFQANLKKVVNGE